MIPINWQFGYPDNRNKKHAQSLDVSFFWRGGRDSNPRSGFTPDNRLAGGPIQPLWHLPGCKPCIRFSAEGEGFEPTVSCPTLVFKTSALNHSAIPPYGIKKPPNVGGFYHKTGTRARIQQKNIVSSLFLII